MTANRYAMRKIWIIRHVMPWLEKVVFNALHAVLTRLLGNVYDWFAPLLQQLSDSKTSERL